MNIWALAGAVLMVLGVAVPMDAQVTGASGEVLSVRIVAASGMAQYREGEESPWNKAEVGVVLGLGAEFRTGLRSRLVFAVGDSHTITLDRLGVIQVLDAIKRDGKVQTEMGMKYGRSVYQVQVGGVEHESKIRTPSATLAVRGSKGFVQEYAGRAPMAGSDYGNVAFVNTQGFEVPLAPETNVEGAQTSAAQQSLSTGTFLPQSGAVTMTEATVIESQPLFGTPSVGGAVKTIADEEVVMDVINEVTGGGNIDGGGVMPDFAYTFGFIDIVAYFRSDPVMQPVDVDIILTPPTGAVVDASNNNPDFLHSGDVVHTGASTIYFNERIIDHGENGFPVGTYVIDVVNQSSTVTAEIELLVDIATNPDNGPASVLHLIGSGEGGEVFSLPPNLGVATPIPVPVSTDELSF
ncbi:MAG: FecR family protein [Planctomycetota bacterium]